MRTQIYPKIHNIACQAADALEQLSDAGKCVDVSSIMSRATAGLLPSYCTARV